jgi:hypothetical protein
MSAIPQIPKLMISTPMTVAMMALPSQLDDAFRIPRSIASVVSGGEGNGRAYTRQLVL